MQEKTALVTGASSGLGMAFARKLASEGYNLILVARREKRLKDLSTELTKKYSIKSDFLIADLSKMEGIEKLTEELSKVSDIDVLINCAGFGLVGSFIELDLERQLDMIYVHDIASYILIRKILPKMVENNSGLIINVSSMSGLMHRYGNVTYTTTKAFLVILSESLQEKLKKTNIKIQALCPGMTRTEYHDTKDLKDFDTSDIPKSMWMSADEVVNRSLKAARKGKTIFVPGVKNRISLWFSNSRLFIKIIRYFVSKRETDQILPKK